MGKVRYDVTLVPVNKDTTGLVRFLLNQGAESLLSKSAAIFIGGIIAPIVAGAAAVLVPSEIGETFCLEDRMQRITGQEYPGLRAYFRVQLGIVLLATKYTGERPAAVVRKLQPLRGTSDSGLLAHLANDVVRTKAITRALHMLQRI